MKKIILAVLTAGLLLSPLMAMADNTTLYGKFRYSFSSVDSDAKDGFSGEDNTSLLGVKGKYGDADLQAFFHLQTGADSDQDGGSAFDQRFYFAGLKSSQLGTIKYGLMTNAYKMPGFKLDRFYNTTNINVAGVHNANGASYGLSGATNGFTDNAFEYTSPKLGDLVTVHGGIYADDTSEDDHGYSYGGKLTFEGITAGVVGATNSDKTATPVPGIGADSDAIRGYGKYQAKDWSLGVSYENVETSTTTDVNYLYVIGSYNLTEQLEAIASFGMVDDGAAEGEGGTGGLFYSIVPNTKVFALVSYASLDDKANALTDDTPTVFSIGFFHNFSMSSN